LDSEAATKKKEYTDIDSQMKGLGVKQNVYTTLTLNDLATAKSQLDAALGKRMDAYKKELARQRENDALCKSFANVAEPFVHWTVEEQHKISHSEDDLEEQLKYVNSRIQSRGVDGAKLNDIKALDQKMEEAKITNNRHTKLTCKDVQVIWEQFAIFLDKKKKMLEGEIERSKLRGITAEQFTEIESNFKQFDANKNGFIEKKELKACLYSLGEEKSRSEIEQILKEYGNGTSIKYDGFKEFMIGILGVSDSKEDIINSFVLINKGAEVAIVEKLDLVMEEQDIQYIKQTAPKSTQGYDYKTWTDDVFSR